MSMARVVITAVVLEGRPMSRQPHITAAGPLPADLRDAIEAINAGGSQGG